MILICADSSSFSNSKKEKEKEIKKNKHAEKRKEKLHTLNKYTRQLRRTPAYTYT